MKKSGPNISDPMSSFDFWDCSSSMKVEINFNDGKIKTHWFLSYMMWLLLSFYLTHLRNAWKNRGWEDKVEILCICFDYNKE